MEGTGGGECTVASKQFINPLNLKIREQPSSFMAPALTQDPALMRRPNKSHSFAEYREKVSPSSSSEKKMSNEENVPNRVRRDRSMIIRAEKLVDEDGKKTNIVSMVRSFKLKVSTKTNFVKYF